MMNRKLWKSVFAAVTASAVFCTGTVYAAEAEQETVIELSDEAILVNGEAVSTDTSAAVYAGAEIVYYQDGQGSTYGEGDADDAHSAEEAAAHTVVTITAPGTYRVSGSISKGQIAVDLGEEAKEDASAVVNLILDNADITCEVASSIVVYNAYECGSDDTETAVKDVDTSAAGFNLILADDSVNNINGSYVAKIYKDGTTQEQVDADEAKKKWKFDAAIDSLVSFNINGETNGNGVLNVTAENEGISSALHMTINGGAVNIQSSDDSINASEDYVSVMTINGGTVVCDSDLGSEGDGIDSNGWLVINGGNVFAGSNPNSMDSGIDSDLGIYINGGTVAAGGNMYDEISEESAQPFIVLSYAQTMPQEQVLLLKNSDGEPVTAFRGENNHQILVFSSDLLKDGDYTLSKIGTVTGIVNHNVCTDIAEYADEVLLQGAAGGVMGFGGMSFPGGMQPGQMPEGMDFAGEMPEGFDPGQMPEGMDFAGEMPEGFDPSQMPEGMDFAGEMPEGFDPSQMPEGMDFAGEMPEGFDPDQMPEGMDFAGEMPEGFDPGQMRGGRGNYSGEQELSTVFTISGIYNAFSQITEAGQNE